MTSQQPDVVDLNGRSFAITAINGIGQFDPTDHGIVTSAISTGCYRGYVATYAVHNGQLNLVGLEVGSAEPPPALDGVEAALNPDKYSWSYRGLVLPVPFTGRMLIGDGDPEDQPYLNMGFWPAWLYADVFDLHFETGLLTATVDCSADLAAIRTESGASLARPTAGESTQEWIRRTFSLTYVYSWPGR